MRLADFDYPLPPERIAQVPIEPRDRSRLLVDLGGGAAEHRHVADLDQLLLPGDLIVLNETRVTPARLRLQRPTGGKAEVLSVVQPAPDQVAAPCPLYGVCGGCQLQTMPLHRQREEKGALVERLVGFPVSGVEGEPEAYGYRNKVELSFGSARFLSEAA